MPPMALHLALGSGEAQCEDFSGSVMLLVRSTLTMSQREKPLEGSV